ncbi:MAG: MATE family efflux transporter [Acidobacteria bacterium]|nr:MATE family efflux transporter [Acidobacteriota bacterium]
MLPFSEYGRLIRLALPLVMTQAGQITVHLVDNAMIGRVGTTELAAASFANSIYVVIMLFGIGVFMGVTPLVSRARGERDDLAAAVLMKSSLAFSGLLIAVVTALAAAVSLAMPLMGQTDAVVRLSLPYYGLLALSTIPLLTFILLKQIGEGLGNTVAAMAATLIANLVNVGGNYVLIFGKFGFPELGLVGAGYATLFSRIVSPLLLVALFACVPSIRSSFALMRRVRASFARFARVLAVGLPIAGQMVLEVAAFSWSAVMMGWLGEVPLASHQIAMGLATFSFMIANAVAMATTIRVSFTLGSADYGGLRRLAWSSVHVAGASMGCCALAFLLLRHDIPRLFTPDGRVIAQAASLLAIAALFQIFDGLQITCIGILRGFADVRAPMLISGFSYMVIGLGTSWFLAFPLGFGPEGIWFGFLAGLAAACALLLVRIRMQLRPGVPEPV